MTSSDVCHCERCGVAYWGPFVLFTAHGGGKPWQLRGLVCRMPDCGGIIVDPASFRDGYAAAYGAGESVATVPTNSEVPR